MRQRWLVVCGGILCGLHVAAQEKTLAQVLAEHPVTRVLEVQPGSLTTIESALKQMSDAADVVFAGEVKAIRRSGNVVEIDWSVEDSIRGVAPNSVYTQREWAGLWPADTQRYAIGQRSLVMLHAVSAAGFSSPVPDGVIPMRGDARTGNVDLRWVMTHVTRAEKSSVGGVQTVHGLDTLIAAEDSTLNPQHLPKRTSVTLQRDDVVVQDGSYVSRAVVTELLQVWNRTREQR